MIEWTRTASSTAQTDRLFTDQRAESAALGVLYDYGARHYDTAAAAADRGAGCTGYDDATREIYLGIDTAGSASKALPNFVFGIKGTALPTAGDTFQVIYDVLRHLIW